MAVVTIVSTLRVLEIFLREVACPAFYSGRPPFHIIFGENFDVSHRWVIYTSIILLTDVGRIRTVFGICEIDTPFSLSSDGGRVAPRGCGPRAERQLCGCMAQSERKL